MISLTSEDFRNFITHDERKRGYVFAFKGEANTTLSSFLEGLFPFLLGGRFTTLRSYNDKAKFIITINYRRRIDSGEIAEFPIESVQKCIGELKNKFDTEDKKFWNGNSATHVSRARILQRASCYLVAIQSDISDLELVEKRIIERKGVQKAPTEPFKGLFAKLFILVICFWIIIISFELIKYLIEVY